MNRGAKIENLVNARLDGMATVAQLSALEGAMRRDPEVRRAVEMGEALVESMAALPAFEPPRDLVAAAEAALVADAGHRARWPRFAFAGVAAASLATSLLVLLVFTNRDLTVESPAIPLMAVEKVAGTHVIAGGEERALAMGDVLRSGDRLETGPGAAHVELGARGSAHRLRLGPDSKLEVAHIGPGMTSVVVEYGFLGARAESVAPIEVRLRGSLRRIVVSEATVEIRYDGENLAVKPVVGEVTVSDSGGERRVRSGETFVITPDSATPPATDAAPEPTPPGKKPGTQRDTGWQWEEPVETQWEWAPATPE